MTVTMKSKGQVFFGNNSFHFYSGEILLKKKKLCLYINILLYSVSQSSPALLQTRGLWPTRLLSPWGFPSKNTRVGCHFLLQGFFPSKDQACNSCVFCTGRQILVSPGKSKYTLKHLISYYQKCFF